MKTNKKQLEPPITPAEFGRRVGVTRAAVDAAMRTGRLKAAVMIVDGKRLIEPTVGLEEWAERDETCTRGNAGVMRERERLLRAQAERAEVELRARKGELLEVDVARNGYANMVVAFRTRCLAIPMQASTRLRVTSEQRIEIEEILEKLIDDALRELSEGGTPPAPKDDL